MNRSHAGLAGLLLSLTFALAAPLLAQGQQITPNYRDADIRQVIEAVGQATGRRFIIDPRVRAQVTMLSFSPMDIDTFYQAFLSMLEVHGYVAVPSDAGGVIEIVPDAGARQLAGAGPTGEGAEMVTQTIKLENVGAAQLVPILRPMIPQYGHLVAHPQSNVLIISDRAANVGRMMSIIRRIDQAGEEDIEVIPLENASATEVVQILSSLNQTAQAAGGPPTIRAIADERTNSVLIAGSQTERLRYRAYIAHLDTPVERGGDTQVRYLRYANAEDLAMKLQTQFASGGTGAAAGAAAGAEGGANPATSGPVSIWSDEGTNALVITAPAPVMQNIMAVIDKIDIRRAQVQVDAVIVEISDDKLAQLGVTWASDGSAHDGAVGVTNFGSTVAGILQLGTASAAGTPDPSSLPEGLALAGGSVSDTGTSWAAVISALRGDSDTNIVATQTIVTMDNEEAEIKVGQEVPFVTGQFTNTGANAGSVNPFQTIQREEVGTNLKITPQINEGNGVTLTIEQENSSLSTSATAAADLVTNKRTITTSVFVDDGNALVLGGLVDDQLLQGEQRVPVLGRIPGLGWLFRARKTTRKKTNLMVFIRPTVLRSADEARFQTNQKYNYFRNLQQQRAQEPVHLMHKEGRPALPDLGQPSASPAPQAAQPESQPQDSDDGGER
jgi:general secretion pathway protein D